MIIIYIPQIFAMNLILNHAGTNEIKWNGYKTNYFRYWIRYHKEFESP